MASACSESAFFAGSLANKIAELKLKIANTSMNLFRFGLKRPIMRI
jgi:hypothetical protein